jgi:hypothetical protein
MKVEKSEAHFHVEGSCGKFWWFFQPIFFFFSWKQGVCDNIIFFKIFSQNGESSPQFFVEISEFPNLPQNKLSV